MDEQKRENLAKAFDELHLELEDVYRRLDMMKRNYPGFNSSQMFQDIWEGVNTASENADALADYIRVASDESWDKA